MPEMPNEVPSKSDDDRREFLKNCGRFAIVTPPTVTMLLSTSLTSNAIAKSGGGGGGGKVKGNNGWATAQIQRTRAAPMAVAFHRAVPARAIPKAALRPAEHVSPAAMPLQENGGQRIEPWTVRIRSIVGCYSPVCGFLAIRSPLCGFRASSPGASAPFCRPANR
jgi:hypothetical protein